MTAISANSTGAALVLHPVLPIAGGSSGTGTARDVDALVQEAVGLAISIDLEVRHAEALVLRKTRPATLITTGHLERLAGVVKDLDIGVVVVDGALTPVQQRNLEKELQAKVIDRTGLILEIFGARARTHEGRLQVELAALTYQRSRLVRSWTHLERQRGGFGFLGGPGESQLEMDRRLIGDRIAKLKRELVDVQRTRSLHRGARKRVPYPIVALVGYTNAGKSTLFNRLTDSGVLAQDMLFATLDPTMRGVRLPSGRRIILSDTVGFISDLPTQLVAAFRATLEEVLEADLILHVRDIAHPDSAAQANDVAAVLTELGVAERLKDSAMEVWNKVDGLGQDEIDAVLARAGSVADGRAVPISALTGFGCGDLVSAVDRFFSAQRMILDLDIDLSDGRALAWLYARGEVLGRDDRDSIAHITVALDPPDLARFRRDFSIGANV